MGLIHAENLCAVRPVSGAEEGGGLAFSKGGELSGLVARAQFCHRAELPELTDPAPGSRWPRAARRFPLVRSITHPSEPQALAASVSLLPLHNPLPPPAAQGGGAA